MGPFASHHQTTRATFPVSAPPTKKLRSEQVYEVTQVHRALGKGLVLYTRTQSVLTVERFVHEALKHLHLQPIEDVSRQSK